MGLSERVRIELYAWLQELPTTNFRIVISVALAVIITAFTLVGIIRGQVTNEQARVLADLQQFILIILGIDMLQYAAKRATYKIEKPPTPDREDA